MSLGLGNGLPFRMLRLGQAIAQLLLDAYPDAAAAYSTRQLRTDYAGSCMRVRRSSDNAEQDIGFAGGVLDETALLAFTGAGNGFVVTWYDQSGNARNATQATAANQPRIVNAGVVDKVNGKAAPVFSNSSLVMQNSTVILQNAASAYTFTAAKYRLASAAARGRIFSAITGSPGVTRVAVLVADVGATEFSSVARRLDADAATSDSTPGAIDSLAALTSAVRYAAGGTNEIFRNGVSNGATALPGSLGNSSDIAGAANTRIGSHDQSGPPSEFWDGNISELIQYNTDQSANRAAIESNIMTHFGIT